MFTYGVYILAYHPLDTTCSVVRFQNTSTKLLSVYGNCVKTIDCLEGYITQTELTKFQNGIHVQPYERNYTLECLQSGKWNRTEDCSSEFLLPPLNYNIIYVLFPRT